MRRRGIAVLGSRQVVVHGLNAARNIVLARLLSPEDFGVYDADCFVWRRVRVAGVGPTGLCYLAAAGVSESAEGGRSARVGTDTIPSNA